MNRFELASASGEAEIRYLDADYKIIRPGAFVRCAVTGLPIPLDELRYWSVEHQEAYADAATALKRYQDEQAKKG